MLGKFENGSFILKTHQMFSFHGTTAGGIQKRNNLVILDLRLGKTRLAKLCDYGVFKFFRLEKRFSKVPFSVDNFSGLV